MVHTQGTMRSVKRAAAAVIALIILLGLLPFHSSRVYAAAVTTAGDETALRKAVNKGGDLKLTKSIMLTDSLTIPSGKTVTLDLGGKTLDRGLAVCQERGSVIIVEAGAKLTIKDSSGKNTGTITGGASFYGGGILNHGTLTVEQGVITGNKAQSTMYGFGGGIDSDSSDGSAASLTIKGGSISGNSARVGGGIFNGSSSVITAYSNTYTVNRIEYVTDLSVTGNRATLHGGGIYNAGVLKVQDKPVVYENGGDDIYLTAGKVITLTGRLESGTKLNVTSQQTDAVITSGYSAYNTAKPGAFFTAGDGSVVMLTSAGNGEVRLKNSAQTTVQVFDGGRLSLTEEYDSPQKAWDKAVSYAGGSKRVEITLGSDWEHDKELYIGGGKNISVDLNGRYILRTRNLEQIDNGGVFRIAGNGTLTIKDSNPNTKGYDGVKGGVITGGASGNTGGGVHMEAGSSLYMEGGTIYECTTNYCGGGICAPSGAKNISLNNCRLYFCQTIDSFDNCHGGGIYAKDVDNLSLRDTTVQDCYREDNGGGLYYWSGVDNKVSIVGSRFIGNKCRDDGGALFLYMADGLLIDKTTFSTNKAGDDGGAIYLDQFEHEHRRRNPITVRDSVMSFNECGDEGSAIFVNKEDLVLAGDTITDNYADDKGAVYLSHYGGAYGYDISVKGRTIIRDNDANDKTHKDIVLENFGATNNYIYDAGLYKDSYISFSALGSGKIAALKDVSEYQLPYFHPESGSLVFGDTREVDAPFVTGSLFSDGSLIILITLACIAIAAAIAAIVIKRVNGGKTDEPDKE